MPSSRARAQAQSSYGTEHVMTEVHKQAAEALQKALDRRDNGGR
ncbi:hypothetical protein [Carbonactinospora thermoautotrophica]|uniref:Uncharacterized protein n=1 Tax=Carbonactinospora thermoautotrophica TaxID=1469144 RepID=A0A132MP25_9ACTN|nr:hypothetical protein [Carbonactinospora thermoautotrophica]KWW99617.1 hypothetical protein LI90_1253 [Carbonactinospora thermoautotrophica]